MVYIGEGLCFLEIYPEYLVVMYRNSNMGSLAMAHT
jgi:hypothetical protein